MKQLKLWAFRTLLLAVTAGIAIGSSYGILAGFIAAHAVTLAAHYQHFGFSLGAAFVKFQPFVEQLAEKVHNLGADTLTVFLTTNANIPTNTFGQLSQVTPIAYTNLSSRVISISTSAQSGGTYKLVLTDLVLTASGAVATFRHVGIYNDTATNDELVCMFDYGSDVTLANGETFTLDFDGTNGLLQLA